MRFPWWLGVVFACTVAVADGRPDRLNLLVLQESDSLGVVLGWRPAPVGRGQSPVVAWDTRLVTPAGDTLARGVASQAPDTLWAIWPAPGDTLRVVGCVRARDARGDLGPFGCSSPPTLVVVVPRPPSAPDSITIDTIPTVLGVRIIPENLRLGRGFGSYLFQLVGYTHGNAPVACSGALLQEQGDSLVMVRGACPRPLWAHSVVRHLDGTVEDPALWDTLIRWTVTRR